MIVTEARKGPRAVYLIHNNEQLKIDQADKVQSARSHSFTSSRIHSEGESLCGGEKKRLGRNNSPQNGRFGGRATSCEGSEEHTIDQARILGRPDRRPDQGENVEFSTSWPKYQSV